MNADPAIPSPPRAPLVRLAWEHTHRELLAAVVFLNRVERMGLPWSLEHVRELQPGRADEEILFLPFYYDTRDLDMYLTGSGFRGKWLVNVAFEQMHFRCGRGYLLPDGRFAREEMLHCAWGERFRDLLVEHGIPPEHIRMTGHPRFDIYHNPSLLFGRDELASKFGLDPGKAWILVPYNFNLVYVTPKAVRRLIRRKYALTEEFIDGIRRARDAFTEMVRALCDAFPDVEVILRVHPAGYEAETIYGQESERRRNLKVIAAYDIANWITQAALTIVWNSTSSMEAMAAGRPVISYEPHPFSERFDYDVNKILPTFSRTDDALAVVAALPEPRLTYDWKLFEAWYKFRDGGNAERLAGIAAEAGERYESHRAGNVGAFRPAALWHALRGSPAARKSPGRNPDHALLQEAVRSLRVTALQDFLR